MSSTLSLAHMIIAFFITINVVCFSMFAWDKHCARTGQWRVRERTLLMLAAVGGVFGAYGARHVLRHKIWKQPFNTYLHLIALLRALWRVMAAMGYCERDADPSKIIRNTAPKGRDATWKPGELARIGKCAWRQGYTGLAALLSVAWDTQLSPGDCRKLRASQPLTDARGTYFLTNRGKTGREVIGTLSSRAVRILDAYLEKVGATLHGDAPIFRNRSGLPYTTDTLGDDFRDVRNFAFPGDSRKLLDIRRSGAVEALAGGADPATMAAKMGNAIDKNRSLAETYLPNRTAAVRLADEARSRGRRVLRENEK